MEISSTQFDKFNAKSWPSPSRTEDGLTEGDLRMDKQRNGGDRWLVILIRWRLKRRRGFSDPWRVWFDIYTTSTVSIQLNNELLISRAKGALPRAFPRNPSIGKVSRTRRVGVSEIGCNTKPLQTVRAHGHLFHPRVLLPLRRQEFLISTTILLGGYYTLCLLSRNTRDSLSLSLWLVRFEKRNRRNNLFRFFFLLFTSFLRVSRREILKKPSPPCGGNEWRGDEWNFNTSNLRRGRLNVIEGNKYGEQLGRSWNTI